MIVKLHHIEFLCNNLQHRLRQFCGLFGFRPFAETFHPNQVALQRSSVQFLLTEGHTARDTVANIALEVKDVESITAHVERNGGIILNEPSIHEDCHGRVISSVIQSPCGNVVHTLLNTSSYGGVFLPGFEKLSNESLNCLPVDCTEPNINEGLLTHLDHVAFACNQGSTRDIIDWYKQCLGFTRFSLNAEETSDGFTIQSSVNNASVGLKLAAMKYWKCSKVGITTIPDDSGDGVKFVLAESLPGQGSNQIQTFLREHGGPGVQHIGLHTPDMVQAVQEWKDAGVALIAPPQEYYAQPEKIQEILSAGHKVKSLMDHNILLDAESFSHQDNKHDTAYLMQVFTRPIFDQDTFFMEVIQRCGATGFGAGNIKALWKALDTHIKNSDNDLNHENTLRY